MSDHSLDACLRVVADRRRRRVIQQLRREADGTMAFDELVNGIQGSDSMRDDERFGNREHLAIELEDTHLPKLADHGVVEYDRRSGAVRYQPVERIETVLDSLPEEASPATL